MAEPASSVRQLVEALAAWTRDERGKVGERASENVSAVLRELGFVTQTEYEELELRVAQLEHRLRLLERPIEPVVAAPGPVPVAAPTAPDLPSTPTS